MTAPGGLFSLEFQHAAARRRLIDAMEAEKQVQAVSTRSRPKAADAFGLCCGQPCDVSTRSRPKAAEIFSCQSAQKTAVSTRSRRTASVL